MKTIVPVKTFGNLSKKFVGEIEEGIHQFPKSVLQKIKRNNLQEIRLASKHSDAFPDAPIVQDFFRKTSDLNSNGFSGELQYLNGDSFHFITLTQNIKTGFADRGVLAHELGHKADDLFKKTLGFSMSELQSFKDTVLRDLQQISQRKAKVNLFLQNKKAKNQNVFNIVSGKNSEPTLQDLREIFADCVASNTTKTQNEIQAKIETTKFIFPNSYEYVRKYLYLVGMK